MQTHEPAGEHAVEDTITIPKSALRGEDHQESAADESYSSILVEARADPLDRSRPLLTVRLDVMSLSPRPDIVHVTVEAEGREEPVSFHAAQLRGGGMMFECAAPDLPRLVRLLGQAAERAKRLGLVPTTGDANA